MSFFAELKRRNVFKVGVAYLVGAWLLIQVSDILLDNIGAPAWVLQTLFVVLGVGFFIAIFFAWAFELTPEGVKREKEVDRSQSITPQTGKKLNNTILVLMALAIGYLLFDKFMGSGSFTGTSVEAVSQADGKPVNEPGPIEPVITKQSIAVLPFSNRSNREEDQFFTDGIHDDLLTTIARIGSMKVISRTSVMEYKDTTKKIPEIAKELGVANILEGGIQRSGNQVRINVQLIDAATDEHLWAEIFDRELTAENLFAIQSEISKAIAEALQATLSPAEEQRIDSRPTDNLQAYDAYLRGRQLMATRDSEKLKLATVEFNKAVELDPDFALAWVGVADSYNLLSVYGTFSREDALPIQQEAIDRALLNDNQLAEAYASLGQVQTEKSQYDAAETSYQRALELSPNYATAYHWYSLLLRRYPLRIDESIALVEKAVELDPHASIFGANLAEAYWYKGLYSLAERQALKVIGDDPGFTPAYMTLASIHSETGEYVKALSYAQKARELDPGSLNPLSSIFLIYLDTEDLDSAEKTSQEMSDLDSGHKRTGAADMLINRAKNNPAATRESINWLMPKVQNDPFLLIYTGLVELSLGDSQRARELFLLADQGWIDPGQWQGLIAGNQTFACAFSWILMQTGDADKGAQLLQQATRYLEEDLPAVIDNAYVWTPDVCYLAAGDKDKALASIETQVTHNYYQGWVFNHSLPMYDLIRFEPRYQAAVAERERHLAVQREAIAAMQVGS